VSAPILEVVAGLAALDPELRALAEQFIEQLLSARAEWARVAAMRYREAGMPEEFVCLADMMAETDERLVEQVKRGVPQ